MHLVAEWGIDARADGKLAPWAAKMLDRHLASCPECRKAAERARAGRSSLALVRQSQPPPLDFDGIGRRLREATAAARPGAAPTGHPAFPRSLVFAAAAAAAIIAVIAVRSDPPKPARIAPLARAPEVVAEPVQGVVTLVRGKAFARGPLGSMERALGAGSKVLEGARIVTAAASVVVVQTAPRTGFRLDERTRAVVTRLRDDGLVISLERGAVGSHVAPLGPGDVYAVRADGLEVQVRGTRFTVVRGDAGVEVEVVEGVVEVSRGDERVALRAPARAMFASRAPLADAPREGALGSPAKLGADVLNLRDRWSEAMAALRVPSTGRLGADQAEVHVDGVTYGGTPLALLREPGPATVEVIRGAITQRSVVDVGPNGAEIEASLDARGPRPAGRAVGRLEESAIRRTIQSHTVEVRRCYERRLKRVPTLRDRVVMHFTVGAEGDVTEARAEGSEADPTIVQCLESAVRGWTFEKPEGGAVSVVYPLTFAPAGSREQTR